MHVILNLKRRNLTGIAIGTTGGCLLTFVGVTIDPARVEFRRVAAMTEVRL